MNERKVGEEEEGANMKKTKGKFVMDPKKISSTKATEEILRKQKEIRRDSRPSKYIDLIGTNGCKATTQIIDP